MKKLLSIIFSVSVLIFMNACTKTDFDDIKYTTPIYEGEAANTSLKAIKDIYTTAFPTTGDQLTESQFVIIEDDLIIEGYVVSDDTQGSFYKNLVIQDKVMNPTQGILIQLGQNSLYTKFALGQKVFIKCKGLTVGKYGGEVQLGGGKLYYKQREWRIAPIAALSIDKHILKDGDLVKITPAVKTINELNADDRFTYITIKDVQFDDASMDQTFGNINDKHNNSFPFKSNTLIDESENTMVVFTSDYSKFAHKKTAKGSGSITGVLSAHKGSNQFVLNTYEDVKMDAARFGKKPLEPITKLDNLDVDFTGLSDISALKGWYNITEAGSRKWITKDFTKDGSPTETYVQASTYKSTDAKSIFTLITPAVNISTQKYLSLSSAKSFWSHAKHPVEVLYSTDFDGSNYQTAEWKTLTIKLALDSDANNAWVESGKTQLPVLDGKYISIAFRYTGSDTETTTLRLDNITITK